MPGRAVIVGVHLAETHPAVSVARPLTPQIDRQAPAPLIVEGEENDGPLDRRRLAPWTATRPELDHLTMNQGASGFR